jgi:hypothetical protein
VAQFLRQQGRQAWALRGGLAAWRAAQYPMQSKHADHAPGPEEECPDCHEDVAAHLARSLIGQFVDNRDVDGNVHPAGLDWRATPAAALAAGAAGRAGGPASHDFGN